MSTLSELYAQQKALNSQIRLAEKQAAKSGEVVIIDGSTISSTMNFEGELPSPVDTDIVPLIRKDADTDIVSSGEITIAELMDRFGADAEGKISEFNANATEKLDAYNSNHTQKLSAYDANASSKLSAYDSNAEDKFDAYNDNDATKLAEYNSNHTSKLAAYNSNDETKTAAYTSMVNDAEAGISAAKSDALSSISTAKTTAIDEIEEAGNSLNLGLVEDLNNTAQQLQDTLEGSIGEMESIEGSVSVMLSQIQSLKDQIAALSASVVAPVVVFDGVAYTVSSYWLDGVLYQDYAVVQTETA